MVCGCFLMSKAPAWCPMALSCDKSRRSCCCMEGRASITRSISPPTRRWPTSPKSSTSITAVTVAAIGAQRTPGRWRNGVMTSSASARALGIERPIVLGTSFGGKVAMAYATRYPAHPAKLILISTEAAGGTHKERRVALFEKLGGPEVGALARRRLFEGHADAAAVADWLRLAFPLYTRTPRDPDTSQRVLANREVLSWFTGPGGEDHRFNLLADLARIVCPTLVMGGEDDPMTPIECQADIAAALPAQLVRFERFSACGHGVVPDAAERALALIRSFIGG